MDIRLQILAPMIFVAVGGLALSGAGAWFSDGAMNETAAVAEGAVRAGELARKAREDFAAAKALEAEVVAMTRLFQPADVKSRFDALTGAVVRDLAALKADARSSDMANASAAAAKAFETWRASAAVALGVEPAPAMPVVDEIEREARAVKAAFDASLDLAGREARARVEAIRADEAWAERWTLASSLAFALLALAGSWRVAARTSRPIRALVAGAERLAKGDVSVTFEAAARRDEIGEIARAVAAFRDNVIAAQSAQAAASEQRDAAETARRQNEDARAAAATEQTRAVDALSQALERLARGDLTARVEGDFNAAYARLKANYNTSLDSLQTTLRSIDQDARDVQGGSSEIAGLATDLNARTGSQTASIEEAAAALEEIATTVKATADNAAKARKVVATTRTEAEKSSVVVRTAVEAIGRIRQSSQQIEKIITVIDEIAFQTNLLALNAGVEAARAGESGRGFAVVATEVRALAQRSADAGREIRSLIAASSAEVQEGVDLVVSAGAALDRIFAQVSEIDQAVGTIAHSAAEQSAGLQSVSSGVSEIDRVNQSNVGIVERTNSACSAVAQRAGQLAAVVARFQLYRAEAAPRRRAA